MHFIPTRSSRLNLVERFFREVTTGCIREGGFQSVGELADAIVGCLAAWNENPTSYAWKAKGEEILKKIKRAKQVLQAVSTSHLRGTSLDGIENRGILRLELVKSRHASIGGDFCYVRLKLDAGLDL
jgi:hypothetical protein